MRKTIGIALLVVLSGLLPSCGGQPSISPEASAILAPQVAGIRAAAAEGDRDRASQHLNRLQTNVAEMIRTGKLSDESARAILDAAAEVESALHLIPSRPRPVTPEQATARPPSRLEDPQGQDNDGGTDARGEDDGDDGNGKGSKGKPGAKGRGKNNDDD